jgi:integrase/recombinase XerD
MNRPVNIVKFPTLKSAPRKTVKRIKDTDGIKYFTSKQINLLRRTVKDQAALHADKKNVTAVREWMVIDLLTNSGIRVSEAANFRCGDIKCGYGASAIFVRDGKGCRSRTVQVPQSLKQHLKQFLSWKASRGEEVSDDDHLFVGQRGPWSSQAIQQIVKKYLKTLGLYENGKSVHALRHSYAVALYRKDRDIRAVQKQLGHSSVQTTQVYADVTAEDLQAQVRRLWGGSNQ